MVNGVGCVDLGKCCLNLNRCLQGAGTDLVRGKIHKQAVCDGRLDLVFLRIWVVRFTPGSVS